MNNYPKHLKYVVEEVLFLQNLRDSYLWSELYEHSKEFAWILLCIFVRLLVLITFPISIPALAFVEMKKEQRRIKDGLKWLDDIKQSTKRFLEKQ